MTPETQIRPAVEIQNLIVSSPKWAQIRIGSFESLVKASRDMKELTSVVWNEESIVLFDKNMTRVVSFTPEINQSISMFFRREEKRENKSLFGMETGRRVWQGDYEPILFSKSNLLKFLKMYAKSDSTPLIQSVKEMKVTERHTRTEQMISLDDDENFQAVEEQIKETNVPRRFSLDLPLVENFSGESVLVKLDFEANVIDKSEIDDSWSNRDKKGKVIQLRCTNARRVMFDTMKAYVESLPETYPKYYGKCEIEKDNIAIVR